MRAHYVKGLSVQDSYALTGDSLHHLVTVVRIEKDEDLLLMDGLGLFVYTKVELISKRELRLKALNHERKSSPYHYDLALAMPKREALELSLKEATELGFRKIYLIKSDYSQMKIPEADRLEKILVSALEQSNAPFLPEVIQSDWNDLPWGSYSEALLMDSQTKSTGSSKPSAGKKLLIVGPEGGFSPSELAYLHSQDVIRVLNLPTPILRTPTAVATGAGIMIESLLK